MQTLKKKKSASLKVLTLFGLIWVTFQNKSDCPDFFGHM